MKTFHAKWLCSALIICFAFSVNAQHLANQLFIHDIKNNSYKKVVEFQAYAVLLNDTGMLKGYFDAVYDNTFLFATKDSVYVLLPEQIKGIAEISGFGNNGIINYSKSGNAALQAGGITLVTLGALLLPGTIALLIDDTGAGAVLSAFTGGMLAGGITMINSASKRRKETQNYLSPEEAVRINHNQLRIIKSPL